ncbi:MAG: dicarboxylate/amino acid:cation symporter [Oscillospiraceae bacterium]|jgi:Na+/H+-dicarboxylate symporter|nr:dicarboxylate/amino acid:cation symporter [Oscillospiraceae bacterium]
MKEKKKLGLGAKILIGLVLGIVVGAIFWVAMGAEAAGAFTGKYIKPFGDIFVNLLKFIVVPLVLFSIMDGVVSMGDIGKVGKIGWKTVVYFLVTTAIACVIGLVVATLFKGSFPVLQLAEDAAYEAKSSNLMDTIVNIFPNNAIAPMANSSMLQIIVIALFFGCGILVAGDKGKLAGDLVVSIDEVTQKVMGFILEVAPYGVFALMVWVVAAQGPKILGSLGLVLLAAYIGYIIHVVLVYSMSVKVFANMSPGTFFKKIFPAAAFAFTSTSSVASLPVTKECCDEMGVHSEISSFVLPLGATINMDGTAIYQCVAAIFLAKCVGIDLTLVQMITIVVTATLASIGTAGTSGAGMIMLAMVLDAVGVPTTYIGIIYGIDRLFDMGRTALNVVGDASCAVCVNTWEAQMDAAKAKAKKA